MPRMFIVLVGSLALPLFGLVLAQPDSAKGRTFAFLVACGDYDKTQLKPVPFTVPEMQAFRQVLIDTGVLATNIVFLHDKTEEARRLLPSRKNIVKEFSLLMERLRPEDSVIVALSGHGLQFQGDKYGYFCPLDAELDKKETLLPMEGKDGLLTMLDQGKAGRKFLIVNACRNKPTGSANLAAEKLQLRDEYNEEAPKGTVMLLACKQNQFSWFYDDKEKKRPERKNRSLFMYHLMEAWKGSYANGKKVTVDHIVAEVTERVEADANPHFGHNQMPIVKRKFDGRWDLVSAMALAPSGYDLPAGYRFCHFRPDNEVWALVLHNDSEAKIYRVWVMDARTGEKIAGPMVHEGGIGNAAFSPDGTRVVTASDDKTAIVWDAKTGLKIAGPLMHQGIVHHAAFSADGTRVVTASRENPSAVWNARTGQKITDLLIPNATTGHAAFSPDGARVVAGRDDGTAVVLDAKTGQKISGPMKHEWQVFHASFSPDGTRVVTASVNSTAVWDARTGKKIAGPLAHNGRVFHASFSPDGTRVVTASGDETAMVWDAKAGLKIVGPLAHKDFSSSKVAPEGAN